MTIDSPIPLLEPNFRWVTQEGRPTPEFYQYFRAFDRNVRFLTGDANQPEVPLPDWTRFEYLEAACSDEALPLTAGAQKLTFRMPYAMELSEVRASLKVAQSSGSAFTVDINQNGATVLSTKLTIDNGERTSTTAAVPSVIATSAITDDAEMTVDIDQIGNGTAIGLKIMLIGTRPAPA